MGRTCVLQCALAVEGIWYSGRVGGQGRLGQKGFWARIGGRRGVAAWTSIYAKRSLT